MGQHIDFYDIFHLDPHASTAELARSLDGHIARTRADGAQDGSPELRRLDVARRVLGEDSRRRQYDERLRAGSGAPAMDVPALEQLAFAGSLPGGVGSHPMSQENGHEANHPPYSAGTQVQAPMQAASGTGPHGTVFKALRPGDAPVTVQVAYWLWLGAAFLGFLLSLFRLVPPFPSILVVILASFTVIRRREAWAPAAGTVIAILVPVIEFLWRMPHVGGGLYGEDALHESTYDHLAIPGISTAFLVIITLALIAGAVLQWLRPSVEWYTGVASPRPAPGPGYGYGAAPAYAPPQAGYVPPQAGYAPPQQGYAPPQAQGGFPAQGGYGPQHGQPGQTGPTGS